MAIPNPLRKLRKCFMRKNFVICCMTSLVLVQVVVIMTIYVAMQRENNQLRAALDVNQRSRPFEQRNRFRPEVKRKHERKTTTTVAQVKITFLRDA